MALSLKDALGENDFSIVQDTLSNITTGASVDSPIASISRMRSNSQISKASYLLLSKNPWLLSSKFFNETTSALIETLEGANDTVEHEIEDRFFKEGDANKVLQLLQGWESAKNEPSFRLRDKINDLVANFVIGKEIYDLVMIITDFSNLKAFFQQIVDTGKCTFSATQQQIYELYAKKAKRENERVEA